MKRRAPRTVIAALATMAAFFGLAAGAQAAGRCGEHPWCDRSMSADARAGLLLAQLTLDEKLDLMSGDDAEGLADPLGSSGTVNGIARLDVPPLYVNDGPGGIRQGIGPQARPATALPAGLALASSFDPRLAMRYAGVIAAEAKRRGHDMVLGPMVNLVRDPRFGRAFESFGEDPRLLSDIGVGWIRGLQRRGVIADVKHFAANNQETSRLTVDEIIDERTLREIYLPQFEAAVRRGRVGTVMTAYNKVNGAYAGANQPLLRETLLGDFGFDGFVLSDWFAGGDTVESALAGQSVVFPIAQYYEPARLRAALAEGRLSTATIDGLVRRYLRVLFRFGVFDRAAYPRDAKIPVKRHGRVARSVEARGIVLLRNRRSLLPLRPRRLDSVAVIGRSADTYQRANSVSSGGVTPFYSVTLLEGLERSARGRYQVRHDDGSDISRAVRVARRADVAVVSASPSFGTGEFLDRPCLGLDCDPEPPHQDRLIRAVARANPKTVVVLQSPSPVLMPWVRRVPAIVEAWWPGEEGGNAIADVLLGRVNPSGKLPVTYPRAAGDVPARTPIQFPGIDRRAEYSEGVLVGYRWYDQRGIRPLYPFGHGLSYTGFRYRELSVRQLGRRAPAGTARVRVSLRVANVGPRRGAEVAQLYLGLPRPAPGVVQPPKALKRFRRVEIPSGRSRAVSFTLDARDFSYWDADSHRWRVAPGCYRLLVGSSSRDIRLRDVIARRGAGCARP
ncbi:MAG TPA: glycoside hydrolase family 3 C-terminal domain-containing protein [Thermoleophilaceae bacterium]|nr:glycoside hydrolase family 3 C-terminal domain-containing protein [Thermoleophilaceae bacterium]